MPDARDSMTRRSIGKSPLMWMRFVVAIACASAVVVSAVDAAQADPMNDESVTLTLFSCSGPPGTPSTFDVTKIPNGGSGFHLVDGTGNFVRKTATDLVTGQTVVSTPGLEHNDLPLVICYVVSPHTGHLILVSGVFTPVGGD
jgi:hypothetical protein